MRWTLALVLVVAVSLPAHAQKFVIDCDPPFDENLELMTEANDKCPVIGGSEDPESAHALQNAAKNNLCAEGEPVEATFVTFQKLQTAIVKKKIDKWSPAKLPPDRSIFHDLITTTNGDVLGEESVVKLVAYVAEVKRGGKEDVNCKLTKSAFIDLHVVLVSHPDAEECRSVTAEVIPHFRPVAWDAATIATPEVPMRFTGQLFVDASHKVCRDGEPIRGQPARFSSWEIHPVYAIDVCKFATKSRCKVNDESVWTPLAEWEEPEEE